MIKSPLFGIAIAIILSIGNAKGQSYFEFGQNNPYTISVQAGIGTYSSVSNRVDHKLFDQQGVVLFNGDYKLRLSDISDLCGLHATVPVRNFSVGFGMEFERLRMFEIELINGSQTETHAFYEYFMMGKFFAHVEYPIVLGRADGWRLLPYARGGYYIMAMVRSTSLFGENRNGATWMGGLGTVVERDLGDWLSVIAGINGEYKYFRNTSLERPTIRQHFFSGALTFGVRAKLW